MEVGALLILIFILGSAQGPPERVSNKAEFPFQENVEETDCLF